MLGSAIKEDVKVELRYKNQALSEDENISQMELEYWNKVTKIEINDGSITTYFKGKIPNISLNIKIKI